MASLHTALAVTISVCAAVFVVAWIVGAVYFGGRRRSGAPDRWHALGRELPRRLLLIAGAAAFSLLVGHTHGFWRRLEYWQPGLAVFGTLLAVASTALLLWARWVLGTMWASVPTVQEHHELRTDGPYRLVRNPIYTGLLGLITGAMLGFGFGVWTGALAVAVPWLLRRVRVEDALMAGRFGASYDAYRAEVPALIPRIRTGSGTGPGHAGTGAR
ncbi:methyltransferase family protein [Streptomyces sp. NPDC001606]